MIEAQFKELENGDLEISVNKKEFNDDFYDHNMEKGKNNYLHYFLEACRALGNNWWDMTHYTSNGSYETLTLCVDVNSMDDGDQRYYDASKIWESDTLFEDLHKKGVAILKRFIFHRGEVFCGQCGTMLHNHELKFNSIKGETCKSCDMYEEEPGESKLLTKLIKYPNCNIYYAVPADYVMTECRHCVIQKHHNESYGCKHGE